MDSNSQFPAAGDHSTKHSLENANSGPNPIVIKTISEIREQRLQKKIRRLIEQRDYWKNEYDKLSYILRLFPYRKAPREFEEFERRKKELARQSELEVTQRLLVSENERLKAEIEKLKST